MLGAVRARSFHLCRPCAFPRHGAREQRLAPPLRPLLCFARTMQNCASAEEVAGAAATRPGPAEPAAAQPSPAIVMRRLSLFLVASGGGRCSQIVVANCRRPRAANASQLAAAARLASAPLRAAVARVGLRRRKEPSSHSSQQRHDDDDDDSKQWLDLRAFAVFAQRACKSLPSLLFARPQFRKAAEARQADKVDQMELASSASRRLVRRRRRAKPTGVLVPPPPPPANEQSHANAPPPRRNEPVARRHTTRINNSCLAGQIAPTAGNVGNQVKEAAAQESLNWRRPRLSSSRPETTRTIAKSSSCQTERFCPNGANKESRCLWRPTRIGCWR